MIRRPLYFGNPTCLKTTGEPIIVDMPDSGKSEEDEKFSFLIAGKTDSFIYFRIPNN